MPSKYDLDIIIEAKNKTKAGFDQLKNDVRGLSDHFARNTNQIASDLKKLWAGEAVRLGLEFARVVREGADAVAEGAVKFRAGEIGAREFAGEIARSIPILGDFTRAWDAVGAAIGESTGLWKSAARELAENQKRAADATKTLDLAEKLRRDASLAGLSADARKLEILRQQTAEVEAQIRAVERAAKETGIGAAVFGSMRADLATSMKAKAQEIVDAAAEAERRAAETVAREQETQRERHQKAEIDAVRETVRIRNELLIGGMREGLQRQLAEIRESTRRALEGVEDERVRASIRLRGHVEELRAQADSTLRSVERPTLRAGVEAGLLGGGIVGTREAFQRDQQSQYLADLKKAQATANGYLAKIAEILGRLKYSDAVTLGF